MATWSDFLAQLRRELEEPTAGVWADASLLQWTNWGADELAIRTKCSRDWQYATLNSGTSVYDLPDYSLEVIDVYCGLTTDTKTKLIRQDFQDWATLPLDTETAKPVYYAIDDANIYLRPSPDDAYELSYFRYCVPTPMTTGTDSMPFESRYNAALGYYVKAKAFEQINDWQSAGEYLARYENEVERIMAQENKERAAGRSVTPREVW